MNSFSLSNQSKSQTLILKHYKHLGFSPTNHRFKKAAGMYALLLIMVIWRLWLVVADEDDDNDTDDVVNDNVVNNTDCSKYADNDNDDVVMLVNSYAVVDALETSAWREKQKLKKTHFIMQITWPSICKVSFFTKVPFVTHRTILQGNRGEKSCLSYAHTTYHTVKRSSICNSLSTYKQRNNVLRDSSNLHFVILNVINYGFQMCTWSYMCHKAIMYRLILEF